MERLPDERRLDQLLDGDEHTVQRLLDTLTHRIVYLQLHRSPILTEEESASWGSYPQLQSKLEENLAFLSLVLNNVDFVKKQLLNSSAQDCASIYRGTLWPHT